MVVATTTYVEKMAAEIDKQPVFHPKRAVGNAITVSKLLQKCSAHNNLHFLEAFTLSGQLNPF